MKFITNTEENMDQTSFQLDLAKEGFPAPVVVERLHGEIGPHEHPFEAKALILEGNITIEVDGVKTEYQVGDVFHLMPHVVHSEMYGALGVKYLVGRKEK